MIILLLRYNLAYNIFSANCIMNYGYCLKSCHIGPGNCIIIQNISGTAYNVNKEDVLGVIVFEIIGSVKNQHVISL